MSLPIFGVADVNNVKILIPVIFPKIIVTIYITRLTNNNYLEINRKVSSFRILFSSMNYMVRVAKILLPFLFIINKFCE